MSLINMMLVIVFVFFNQKTAYEMRISDWSSDVCSSDLIETAKRIRQRISAIYAYAIASGLAETDPAEKVGAALKPLPKKGRQPAITDITELRRMLATVDGDFARPITRLALRLIALTAVRPGELRGALWSEFEELAGKEDR